MERGGGRSGGGRWRGEAGEVGREKGDRGGGGEARGRGKGGVGEKERKKDMRNRQKVRQQNVMHKYEQIHRNITIMYNINNRKQIFPLFYSFFFLPVLPTCGHHPVFTKIINKEEIKRERRN